MDQTALMAVFFLKPPRNFHIIQHIAYVYVSTKFYDSSTSRFCVDVFLVFFLQNAKFDELSYVVVTSRLPD
jgi:hypothetical protein